MGNITGVVRSNSEPANTSVEVSLSQPLFEVGRVSVTNDRMKTLLKVNCSRGLHKLYYIY